MNQITVGIAMNGVTGRMGYRQHLTRSILPIREQGGIEVGNTVVMPEPVLVGRNPDKIEALAARHGIERWTTSLEEALNGPRISVYFDAQATALREKAIRSAIEAGKHIYTEKPTAESLAGALELARLAVDAGVKSGVVQDKLFLPGLLKLKRLVDAGFFGRILSVRGDFGYWVFEGDGRPAQRPSWNYRAEDGGGLVKDMFPHWRYLLEHLVGPVLTVAAATATHIPQRWDESGQPYQATADDAAYAIFELAGNPHPIPAVITSSWATRVYRDDLVAFQIDGTEGSAVAGLRTCRIQHRSMTPAPEWNPDLPQTTDFRSQWAPVPEEDYDNAFKAQWEQFLRHVAFDEPYTMDLFDGAKGVQLADLGLASAHTGRRMDVPELSR